MSESTVFVVRVWHDAGVFRATARAVESDDASAFSDPAELLRFLAPEAARARIPGGRPESHRAPRTGTVSKRTAGEE